MNSKTGNLDDRLKAAEAWLDERKKPTPPPPPHEPLLVECRACHNPVSVRAPACPRCGEPRGPGASTLAEIAPAPQKPLLLCPGCGSGEVQKVSLAYELGTKTTAGSALTAGAGLASGHHHMGGLALTATSGKSQSLLAGRLAPPKKTADSGGCLAAVSGVFGGAVGLGIGAAVGGDVGGAIGGCIGLVAGLALVVPSTTASAKEAKAEYDRKLAEWNLLWFCNRCGNTFNPGAAK